MGQTVCLHVPFQFKKLKSPFIYKQNKISICGITGEIIKGRDRKHIMVEVQIRFRPMNPTSTEWMPERQYVPVQCDQ